MTINEAIEHCEKAAAEKTEQGKCSKCAAEHKQLAEWLKELVTLRAQTDTQPNDPLTLDELREMDGELVWVVEEQRYGILEVGDNNFVVTFNHLKWGIICPVQTEDRVGGMTFYRRKPENTQS